jgi:hypothetical protein
MKGERNEIGLRYDLIPGEVLDYIAERLGYGSAKYGDNNWKLGLPGAKAPVNHALAHLTEYLKSRAQNYGPLTAEEKDDLQAVLTNLAFEVYYREHPELYTWENRYIAPAQETEPMATIRGLNQEAHYDPAHNIYAQTHDISAQTPYANPPATTDNPFSRFFNFNK